MQNLVKLSLVVFKLYELFSHVRTDGRTDGWTDVKKNRVIEKLKSKNYLRYQYNQNNQWIYIENWFYFSKMYADHKTNIF